MTTTRFTYVQHDDNLVELVETGGLFFGHTVDEVRRVAEELYPNYQHGNLSYTFSDQYFNHTLRRSLLCSLYQPTTNMPQQEPDSQTNSEESGRSKSSISKASSSG